MCSSTRGPAIWPSLVTWPISRRALPRCLAKRISAWAAARSWVTVPGACSSPSTHMVWIESTITRSGAVRAVDRGQHVAGRGGAGQLDRRVGEAQPAGAQPDLVDRFLAADIDHRRGPGRPARRPPAASACSCRCRGRRRSGWQHRPRCRRPGRGRARRCRSAARGGGTVAALRAARARAAGRAPCRRLPAPGSPPPPRRGCSRRRNRRSGRPSAACAAPQLWQTKARCGLAIRPAIAAGTDLDRALGAAVDELVDVRVAAGVDRSAGPSQTIRPSYSMATRSAILRTLAMSWVIDRAVAPSWRTQRTISSLITSAMIGSRPVVGSSKNRISGSWAMARARPTRFCIPPDSSAGISPATSGAEADHAQGLARPWPGLRAVDPLGGEQAEGHVLPDRQAVEQRAALEQHAELAAQLVHGVARQRPPPRRRRCGSSRCRASSGRART